MRRLRSYNPDAIAFLGFNYHSLGWKYPVVYTSYLYKLYKAFLSYMLYHQSDFVHVCCNHDLLLASSLLRYDIAEVIYLYLIA